LKDGIEVPRTSLEETETNLEGQSKAMFLAFMRKMLRWRPEERSTAKDLLRGTWLRDRAYFADG
jgi:serine/threonine-protein kinase SRPK3